jgi:hypothetical protein
MLILNSNNSVRLQAIFMRASSIVDQPLRELIAGAVHYSIRLVQLDLRLRMHNSAQGAISTLEPCRRQAGVDFERRTCIQGI